ncbi:alpha-amylase family glycosyl hydrolase [Saccharopolyspora gloriosae]|uniref:alpha-amylase family glycosyl hydrolase n=1 Tax=Saccharopolyspora gloriosae TaxID=455344 RepID=UPI001FB75892|nr:alpha-amylase family glycosyl hydrolase [Saccharopolyspora gloriosae]
MNAPVGDSRAASAAPWWSDAVFYRVDLRSFADANGDGVGDLDGARLRLGYLELLGVDALWLTALTASPLTDPARGRGVDPVLGELESFESLVDEAHASGLRVAIDVAAQRDLVDRIGTDGHEVFATSVRFWLDRGVDALRVAVAPGAGEPAGAAVREVLRELAPIAADYPGRGIGVLIDESWFDSYADHAGWDIGIDLRLGRTLFDAADLREVITRMLSSAEMLGVPAVWVVAGEDRTHPVTRFGGGASGEARARALALVSLGLPGIVGLDTGEELGLPTAGGSRSASPTHGPMPWEGDEPSFGFSPVPGGWWPMSEEWAPYTVEAQLEDPDSTLSLYRSALELRKEHPALRGDQVSWFGAPPGCLAFRREPGELTCALNASAESVTLPPGEVLLASGPLEGDRLPPNTAVWLI